MAPRNRTAPGTSSPPVDPLERAFAAVVADARLQVRAGRHPDRKALEARVRGAAERRRQELAGDPAPGAEQAALDRLEAEALEQLERVVAVHLAFRRLSRPATPGPASPPPPAASTGPRRFGGFRPKPTVSGTLDVRRAERDGIVTLSWDPLPAVKTWEVRFSRKADARGDYEADETVTLPAEVTSVVLPLDERLLRVNVIGQARDGRPVRRVLVSALTAENWDDRWERRATAS